MTAQIQLFGIANCDTVKKARLWLAQHSIEVEFVDFKKHPASLDQLTQWSEQLGWQNLLKKTGTTWRSLPEVDREGIDEQKAIVLMNQHINLIKRPLLVKEGRVLLSGFKPLEWENSFQTINND